MMWTINAPERATAQGRSKLAIPFDTVAKWGDEIHQLRTAKDSGIGRAADTTAPPVRSSSSHWGEKKIAPGVGGGGARRSISQPLPLLGRHTGRGGSGRGVPYLPCRGAGNPTEMAQNDPHVGLIIYFDYTYVRICGDILVEKNFFRPKFVFRRLWRQHPLLHKTKGAARQPISPPPPPRRASVPSPPPPGAIFRSPGLPGEAK